MTKINRSERRRQQRELEKKTKSELNVMKRLCGRSEKTNALDWALNLNSKEQEYLNFMMTENSKYDIQIYIDAYEMALRCNLNDDTEIINKINRDVEKESYKVKEYRDNGGDYIMALKNNKEAIIKDYEKGIANNIKEKDLIKDLAVNYKATQNAIRLIVKDYKKSKEDKEIEEAAAYILEEDNQQEVVNTTAENEEIKPLENNKKSKYKIIKEVVQRDIQGEHGVYHIENGSMTIDSITYDSKEDIEKDYEIATDLIEKEYNAKLEELEVLKKEKIDNAVSSRNEALEIMEEFM